MIHPARYQSFYDAIRSSLPSLPLQRLEAGTIVMRSVAAVYKGVAASADSARTIWGGSLADYRWTGARARGPGRGALYVSLHLDALTNELLHYAQHNPSLPVNLAVGRVLTQDALAATTTFRYALTDSIFVVDVSPASPAGMAFLEHLRAQKRVRDALTAAKYTTFQQAYEADDYSFCRALGHALLDESAALIDGLRVTTARNQWPKLGETAENLALFGDDGVPLRYLRPLTQTQYGTDAAGKLTQTVKRFV